MLMETQIAVTCNHRKLLRSQSSFTRVYIKYLESTYAAKTFLKTVLFEPIMSVLMEDERECELDPPKKSLESILKSATKIDKETANDWMENLLSNEQRSNSQIYVYATKFVKSIRDNWCLLPSTLRWLSQSMSRILAQAKLPEKEIKIVLTDMIFTNFICPAILNPNIYGIIDAPISENIRFNLIQIGQILQMLALVEDQPLDSKLKDVLNQFERNCISALLEQLYKNDTSKINNGESDVKYQSSTGVKFILATYEELVISMHLLKSSLQNSSLPVPGDEQKKLKQILDQLSDFAEIVLEDSTVASESLSGNSNTRLYPKLKNRSTHSKNTSNPSSDYSERKQNTLSNKCVGSDTVLIIPLPLNDGKRLLTEEELLNNVPNERSAENSKEIYDNQIILVNNRDNYVLENNREKQKSFSLPQDDASLGNTSDNLEAVSEAQSNHSVASSLELEEADQNDNDNLSDMISANVSGRGSPNISGRDTPSSQVTEGGGEVQQFATSHMSKISNKARSDIEDKFCKFEIKKLIEGDETISIISDTWSTDVLASDCEALETNERNFATPLIPTMPLLPGDHNFIPLTGNFRQLRIGNIDSETRSESAWSTDAVMDTDDNQSVTTRSETTEATVREQEMLIDLESSLYASKSAHFGNVDNSNHELTRRTTANEIITMEQSTSGRHNQNCSRHLQVRRSSTDSSMSTNDAETKTNSNRNNAHENTIRTCTTCKKSISKLHTSIDNSYEKLKVTDYSSSNCASATNNKVEANSAFRFSLNPDHDTSDVVYCNFLPTNYINNNNKEIVSTACENTSVSACISIEEELISVEHRRLSSEQRNATFDSRRNGMMDIPGNFSGLSCAMNNTLEKDSLIALDNPKKTVSELVTPKDVMLITTKDESDLPDLTSPCLIKMAQIAKREPLVSSAQSEKGFMLQSIDKEEKSNKVVCSNFDSSTVKEFSQPEKLTGTIPKSISFDSSADKVDRNDSTIISMPETSRSFDVLKPHGGFFAKIKLGFKNRRSINNKLRFSYTNNNGHVVSINGNDSFSPMNTFVQKDLETMNETTEDILAKYRRKTSSSSETGASDSTSNNSSSNKSRNAHGEHRNSTDRNNGEYFTTFTALKRKLRFVLSTVDIYPCDFEPYEDYNATPLQMYLRIVQSQALSNHTSQQLSCISEVLRIIQTIKAEAQQNLLLDLQNDIHTRQAYIQYLISCRQTLLSSIDNLASYSNNLQQENRSIIHHIMMIAAKHFLEKKENVVQKFYREFVKLTVVDEKIDMLQEFLNSLTEDLRTDEVLDYMTDWQISEARYCMECVLLEQLYQLVMFPNNDGDIFRDQVLFDHIKRLSRSITPSHKLLRISSAYLSEAPWPQAQRQLSFISAYKTPNEKVECVLKCMQSLISVLSMGSDRSVTADDMTPVFIYVLVQVNPPNLLSTIEYVNSFIGDKLSGEKEYWWTQFCSAVTFIKTMDYCE